MGYFLSLVVYFFLIWLFGFLIATALFTFLFLYGWVKMPLSRMLSYTACLVGVAALLGWALGLYWPEGLLGGW